MTENTLQPILSDLRKGRPGRRWKSRGGREWILGLVLIMLGGIVLLPNARIYTLNNWWALFILLPALGAFSAAGWHIRQAGGRLTRPARGAILIGLILLAVTVAFLLSLKWTIFGPALLVLAGLGLFINALLPDGTGPSVEG